MSWRRIAVVGVVLVLLLVTVAILWRRGASLMQTATEEGGPICGTAPGCNLQGDDLAGASGPALPA
jgi:hypothetical protein